MTEDSEFGVNASNTAFFMLPYFFASFILFAFGRKVFELCGLTNTEDAGKEFETREDYLVRSAPALPCQRADTYDEFQDSIEMSAR